MELYRSNLEFITKRGFLVDMNGLQAGFGGEVEFFDSRSGLLTFAITRQGKRLSFHSPYDPLQEAVRLAEKEQEIKEPHIIVVYGLGLGYHVAALRSKFGPNPYIIAVEPDPGLLALAMQRIDLKQILDNKTLLVCSKTPNLALQQVAKLFHVATSNRIIFVEHPVYGKEYREYFDGLTKQISNFISDQVCNVSTTLNFNEKWLINNLANLGDFYKNPGINALENKFSDFPAIVVSAGPSLDKNIDLLKLAKDKALIIAVGTALKSLLNKGIRPNLVVTIDGGDKNFCHFEGVEWSEVPLVFEPMAYPEILRSHSGKKFTFSTGQKFIKWVQQRVGEKGLLPAGGSVATSAFSLAQRLGAEPIILVGQDLAFAGDKTHTSGSVYGEMQVKIDPGNLTQYVQIKGYYGGEVWTSRSLFTFLRWFEHAAKHHTNGTIINATEGGATIAGTVQMSLQEALDQYCKRPKEVDSIIGEAWASYEPVDSRELINSLKDIAVRLDKMARACEDGMEDGKKILRKIESGSMNDLAGPLKRLKKVDKVFKKEQEVVEFLNEALHRVSLSVLRKSQNMEDKCTEDWAKLAELFIDFYGVAGPVCRRFHECFQEAIKNIQGGVN